MLVWTHGELSRGNEKGEKRKKALTIDACAWADLVLPLSGHDLCIGTGNVDAGVQAGLVVCLDNVSAKDLARSDTTVVWTLGSGETALGPAIWPALKVEERVLLLETEPELVLLVCLHDDGSIVAEVECIGLAIRHPGLGKHEDVVTATEGIGEGSDRSEVDVRVVPWGLGSRRAVKVPLLEGLDGFFGLVDGSLGPVPVLHVLFLVESLQARTLAWPHGGGVCVCVRACMRARACMSFLKLASPIAPGSRWQKDWEGDSCRAHQQGERGAFMRRPSSAEGGHPKPSRS